MKNTSTVYLELSPKEPPVLKQKSFALARRILMERITRATKNQTTERLFGKMKRWVDVSAKFDTFTRIEIRKSNFTLVSNE